MLICRSGLAELTSVDQAHSLMDMSRWAGIRADPTLRTNRATRAGSTIPTEIGRKIDIPN